MWGFFILNAHKLFEPEYVHPHIGCPFYPQYQCAVFVLTSDTSGV